MTEAEWLACEDPEAMLGAAADHRKRFLFEIACCRRVIRVSSDPRVRLAFATTDRFIEGSATISELTAIHESLGKAIEDAWHACYAAEADAHFCPHPGYSAAGAAESVAYAVGSIFDQQTVGALSPTLARGFNTDGGVHRHAMWAAVQEMEARFQMAGRRSLPLDQQQRVLADCKNLLEGMRISELAVQANLLREIFGNPFRPVALAPEWRTSTAVALAKQMYESRDFDAMPILADALQDAGCDNADVLNHCRDANGVHVRGCWVVDLVLGKT